jgi:O-acetyl-ADP-ribose deacetylase (regulator of RNase III)
LLDQDVDAWATPTNARGRMDGGVDAAIKHHLGAGIERRVQQEIAQRHQGVLRVGSAICVPTGATVPRFLISTPTMARSVENIGGTANAAWACAAAFQILHAHNAPHPGAITSVALPGMGAATGRVPPRACAELMRLGYDLAADGVCPDFETLHAALRERLEAPARVADRGRAPDYALAF